MIQNQVFARLHSALIFSLTLATFVVPSHAMMKRQRSPSPEPAGDAAIANALVALIQATQNASPGALGRAVAQVAGALPEGLQHLAVTLAPVTEAAAPRTPVQQKQRSRLAGTPGGSVLRTLDPNEAFPLGLTVAVSPLSVDARSVVYVGCDGKVTFKRFDLRGRHLSKRQIVDLFLRVVEELVAAGILDAGFYLGRAEDPVERGLNGHFADMRNKDGQRKAEAFKKICEDGGIPTIHHILRNAHPQQLDFLEGIGIMVTGANCRPTGYNSKRPSEQSRSFYNEHLKSLVPAAVARGEERRRIQDERLALSARTLDEKCSGKDSQGSNKENDSDDDGGFGGSSDPAGSPPLIH